MIKFCIALALLATISLSAVCDTNVILASGVACQCHASSSETQYSMCDYGLGSCAYFGNQDTRSSYCKRVGTTYTMVAFPDSGTLSTTCGSDYTSLDVNTQWTNADCRINPNKNAGNKICPQNGVYKESATACPLMPDNPNSPLCSGVSAFTSTAVNDKYGGALCVLSISNDNTVCPPNKVYRASSASCPLIPACPEDQILSGDIPCFCYTSTAQITGTERNNNAASGKFCNSRTGGNAAVKAIGILAACTAFDKIENEAYCLSKAHIANAATEICYEDQYTDGTTINGCTDWPNTCSSNQKKNKVKLTSACECVTDELCKIDSYCWPDSTQSCNAAKKTCATGKMTDGSIYACSSGKSYVTATADTLCPENTGSGTGCVDDTCCKPTCGVSDTVAITTVGGCVCETGVVCEQNKFCLKGNKCTDAAKDCVHGAPNVGTIYSCTGTGWTFVTANNATPCPSGVCNDDTCCMANCSTFDCGKLDKTTTDCPSTGCTKLLCCEAFISSKNSALTMGVQTAAFMVIMIFI